MFYLQAKMQSTSRISYMWPVFLFNVHITFFLHNTATVLHIKYVALNMPFMSSNRQIHISRTFIARDL